jgi:hypothetical protein
VSRIGLVALTVALAVFLSAAPAPGAKGKGAGRLDVSKTVNAPIPDASLPPGPAGAIGAFGVLTSTIDAGKQFKGRKVRDVNVTVQTVGTSGPSPADDLVARLTAPNGASVDLFVTLFGTVNPMTFMPNPTPSIGPLTLDDESPLSLGSGNPSNATELFVPWAGSAEPEGKPLAVMDNGPVRGTWTLALIDTSNFNPPGPERSNLVSWRLQVVAGKPFLTK